MTLTFLHLFFDQLLTDLNLLSLVLNLHTEQCSLVNMIKSNLNKVFKQLNSLICPKNKSASHCTVPPNYSQSIQIIIGPSDGGTIISSSRRPTVLNWRLTDFISEADKGQLISKANCQVVNSSKKQTNEFIFTSMRLVFVHFLEEIKDSKKTFRNYLTFKQSQTKCDQFFFFRQPTILINFLTLNPES